MGRRPSGGDFRREAQELTDLAIMPKVRGRLTPNAPLAPLVWFKSGGNAEWERQGRGRNGDL